MSVDVVLLRSSDQPDRYSQAFAEAGLNAVCRPVLAFEFPYQNALTEQLQAPGSVGALVVTSPRAAAAVERIFRISPDLASTWADRPVFVVGPKTAASVRALGLRPVGEEAGRAANLVDRIRDAWVKETVQAPLLFLSGNRRKDTLPEGLEAAGIPFSEQVVYRTRTRSSIQIPPSARWLVFFSPSGVEAVRNAEIRPGDYRTAAIGPTTATALRDVGVRPEALAEAPTPEALVAAVVTATRDREGEP